jgi:hypothetical protein
VIVAVCLIAFQWSKNQEEEEEEEEEEECQLL